MSLESIIAAFGGANPLDVAIMESGHATGEELLADWGKLRQVPEAELETHLEAYRASLNGGTIVLPWFAFEPLRVVAQKRKKTDAPVQATDTGPPPDPAQKRPRTKFVKKRGRRFH